MSAIGNPVLLVVITLVTMLAMASSCRATVMPADPEYVQSLNGTWRFKLERGGWDGTKIRSIGEREPITTPETFEPFNTLDYREDDSWHDLAVPGNWEMAGYSAATYNQPDNASGFYRKWIQIPAEWTGRLVKVNFDGVQLGAEVWLNGEPVNVTEPSWGRANYHESGWTAWQADLTPHVKFGQKNLLAMRVTKNTKSSDLDSGDYFLLGGIHRPVTLFSVPKTHIKDLTIRTHLLDNGKAEVRVLVDTEGVADSLPTVSMRFDDGKPAGIPTNAKGHAELSLIVSSPKLWSAEHPNLYPLVIELRDSKGQVLETITRRVGIREVTVEDGVFKVNGVAVKMTGICRHDVYLPVGTAVGEDLWRKDLTMMKAANINAVRTSHYPYGSGFYDLCDEMGFYVLDELPYCWCPTDDPELTSAYLQRARETIARDKNHACVVVWAIGNENKAGINQKIVADAVKELDPTRPRLNSERAAEENGVEFDDRHYTNPEKMTEQATSNNRERWPLIYTENPNIWDVRFGADYGCLDLWAPVLQRCWDVIWKYEGVSGGFLWEWQDRAVCDKHPSKPYEYDPATGVQYLKTKGIVDGWRNPRPELYHVKMVYSPIKIEPQVDMTSKPGSAMIGITNRYSFTDLSELNTNWKLIRGGKVVKSGAAHLKMAPRTTGKVELKLPADVEADELQVDFDHPGGWNVVSHKFVFRRVGTPSQRQELQDALRFPRLNLVRNETVNDAVRWRKITRYRGQLANVKTDPQVADDPFSRPLTEIKSLDADIVMDNEPGKVVGRLHAEYADGSFSYKVKWTGEKADIQELGWTFEMPHSFERFSWERQALWSVYPDYHIGRPAGTALPDTADMHLTNVSRPDAFDFNSTKYDCHWASLTDSKGLGLLVSFASDQRHHVRGGFGADGAYQLIVNKQCSPPRDISSNVVPDMYLQLERGESIQGSFVVGSL